MSGPAEPAVYGERLAPPWWWWVLGVIGAVTPGAQLWFSGFSVWQALPFSLVPVLLVVAGLGWLSRGFITVTATRIRAGRHELALDAVATVEELDQAHTRRMLGPAADPSAPVFQRPWVHTSVRVLPRLEHPPYLLVSTRRPDLMAGAIVRAVAALDLPTAHRPSSGPITD